jgi:hypothetical protein
LIRKQASLPYKVIGLEALLSRLPESHVKYGEIEKELRIARAGENGEKILRSVFEKYTFQGEHYIFHDLNLKSSGLFQIDTLFLSHQGAFILEMKNIAGRIQFSEINKQLVRTLETGQVDSFECPSVQLERNKMLLADWFLAQQLSIPIEGAVVFPRPQQQFENAREHLKILFPLEIPVYLRTREATPLPLHPINLREIAERILQSHMEYNPFPLCEKYRIEPLDLLTGVRCEICASVGMHAVFKGWYCAVCKHRSEAGHLRALLDYFMVVNQTMSSKQCREFLHLPQTNKIHRILQQTDTTLLGKARATKYGMDLNQITQLMRRLENK